VNSRTCARIFTFWFAGFALNAQAALDSAAKVREKAASGTNSLEVAPGYALTEIPYSGTPLVWVDDRTVLFVGAPISISKKPSPQGVTAEILLYRWNISTSEVVPIAKAGAYPQLCYDRGFLRFSFIRGDHRMVREGPIGHESESVLQRDTGLSPKEFFNPYNCRFRPVPAATRLDHGVVAVLRDDHGFIEGERPSERVSQRNYFLVRPSGERIWLKNFHGGPGNPAFSQFRQAYVFQYGGSDLSKDAEKHVWEIGIDGNVTDNKLPKGTWLGGAVKAMPVRDALLLISPNTLDEAEGVYLIRGQQVQFVVNGYVNAFAVAPNGCKVAINVRRRDRAPRHAVLDVCKGGN
jgi:hypothetical protein